MHHLIGSSELPLAPLSKDFHLTVAERQDGAKTHEPRPRKGSTHLHFGPGNDRDILENTHQDLLPLSVLKN